MMNSILNSLLLTLKDIITGSIILIIQMLINSFCNFNLKKKKQLKTLQNELYLSIKFYNKRKTSIF